MRHPFVWLLLSFLLSNAVFGQPSRYATEGMVHMDITGGLPVWAGTSFPPHPTEGLWFCNSERRDDIHVFRQGEWKRIEALNGYCPELRHGFVWINGHTRGTLFKLNGDPLMDNVTHFTKMGNLVYGHCGYRAFVLNTNGDTLSYFPGGLGLPGFQSGVPAGPEGLSLPAYVRGTVPGTDDDRRDWGMVDTLGNWIIPPIYDQWFIFKDGVAEVLRYGVRFMIDRNGNRVD